ncbi:MAG: chorismate synthase [Ruminococcus sp.]|nr:chorismate synthase [Ruminococcus sp.]
MSLIWNNKISVSYFGETHDSIIGVTLDGIPAGEYIDADEICGFIKRMNPKSMGNNGITPTPRIISGLRGERTTGAPICAVFQNSVSHKEDEDIPANTRIGHGDYTGAVRYRGFCDVQKDAHTPEQFTEPVCFAGSVCAQILERRGIYTGAHILSIHNIKDNPYDMAHISRDSVRSVRSKDFPVINDRIGWDMLEDISLASEYGETLGGIVECATVNIPCGAGSPLFHGIQNTIAQLIFAVPYVTGLEFGAGFESADMTGSQYSDNFYTDERGYSVTRTNNHGGITGGISTGMPVVIRVAVAPPPKNSGEVCIVPKTAVCIESAVNTAVLSCMIDYPNFC